MAVADFDRDGDVDIVVGHSHFRCEGFWDTECDETRQVRLYENTFGSQNNWIQIRPVAGTSGTASLVGATITVQHGEAFQTRVVDGGHGRFGLQGDPTLHFGLGGDCEAEVTVQWPGLTGVTETFTLQANKAYRVNPNGAALMD